MEDEKREKERKLEWKENREWGGMPIGNFNEWWNTLSQEQMMRVISLKK